MNVGENAKTEFSVHIKQYSLRTVTKTKDKFSLWLHKCELSQLPLLHLKQLKNRRYDTGRLGSESARIRGCHRLSDLDVE